MGKDTEPIPSKMAIVSPASNTPEVADLLDRAQSGDVEALKQIMLSGQDVIFVNDMPGQLRKFDEQNKTRNS